MLFKNYHIVFIIFLITGTTIAVSSNSWFTAWIGLELNLISVIPLFIFKITTSSVELSIKYFLPQAIASLIIIMYATIDLVLANYMFINFTPILLIAALLIKLGLPPFYFWFPQIISKLNWVMCMLLISWQKLAPFFLITTILNNRIIILIVLTAASIGALGGFNQNLTKLIIAYSSISHAAWIIPLINFSVNNWSIYFLIYCVISFSLIYLLNINYIDKISKFSYVNTTNLYKLNFSLVLISLGGLPPLLGFLAKLNAIIVIINFLASSVLFVMIIRSLTSLFYYVKIIYRILIVYPSKIFKILKIYNDSNKSNIILWTTLTGNLIRPLIVSLI